MTTRYPIVLVHGVAIKEFKLLKAFGKIGKVLLRAGYNVYTSDTDGFGTIENNAEQLKIQILGILKETGAEKVNIIAHSKGGLDAKYMINSLDMGNTVASLTTICTPHKGSKIATWLYRKPRFLMNFIAFWVNFWYRLFGDKHPDALSVCKQLQAAPDDFSEQVLDENIYCQSYSSTLKRGRDDFLMSIPYTLMRFEKETPSDGMVSNASAKFGEYKGDCLKDSVSHSEIIGYSLHKKKRERVHEFYLALCRDLAERGF